MASTVQHVTKASSDQLLLKFADESSPASAANSPRGAMAGRLAVRRKRSRRALAALSTRDLAPSSGGGGEILGRRRRRMSGGGMAEWKSLLPAAPGCRRRSASASASLLRRLGIEDAEGIRCFLAALEKTWRRTVEGASRMFIEKYHCDNHLQLISDVV